MTDHEVLPNGEYLVTGRRPTPAECARGATLIPSMLDEGVMMWRVPALPLADRQAKKSRDRIGPKSNMCSD